MTVTITKPVRRRPQFHALPVAALDPLTEDAVAVTFAVPEELRPVFAFSAGQHLTVRLEASGQDVRRSYSICSTPRDLAERGVLRIGVKAVPGGVFSRYALGELQAGHAVQVLPPLGHFTSAFAPGRARSYVAVAAGSGITPVLSVITTALEVEPGSTITLVYGNRYAHSVMFADELADLKDRFPARLAIVHVLSREPRDAELLSGRIDAARFARMLDAGLVDAGADEYFLCGPYGMVTDVRAVLAERGAPEAAVHAELFHVADGAVPAPAPVRADPEAAGPGATGPGAAGSEAAGSEAAGSEVAATELTIRLDGRESRVMMRPGERVLDAALRVRGELPYSCRGGVCSTCRARVIDGTVEMARNWALEPDELAAGYVLTCQATPTTPTLTVDYDA